ncbi:MAG: membrane protein insertase YidC [Candidatus Limisoma sp.]|nr:membrane protein insertase YidC [Bacteroidales bacterium]MDY5899573.1 membrane protein insertase YidC [Candidatus Limisoma sp.]MDY6000243.1 membrane protein insertase YidC [Candidatus Limisoma sp.]
MDRNTILGLVLMGVVIFAFSWLNSPSEEELKATAETQTEQKESASVAVVDSLSATELAEIKTIVAQYGKKSDDGVATTLRHGDVVLTLAGDELAGTVKAGGKEFSLDDLAKPAADSVRLVFNSAVKAVRLAVGEASKYSDFARFVSGDSTTVRLQNDLVAVDLSTKGGVVSRVELKKYTAYSEGKTVPAVLFENENNAYSFILNNDTQRFDTHDFYFTPVVENDSTVLMKLQFESNVSFGIRYTLKKDSYMVKMDVVQENMNTVIPTNIATMDFEWRGRLQRHERGEMFEERNSGLYYKYNGGDTDYLSETSDDEEEIADKLKWIGFKDQFFSTVLIADSYFLGTSNLRSTPVDKDSPDYKKYMKDLEVVSSLEYSSSNPTAASFTFVFCPNEYSLLDTYSEAFGDDDLELTRLIPLGWKMFRWINTGIIIPVFNFLGTLDLNYGIIILLLTIFIKVILFPLTYKSYSSQAKMRFLAPDIKAINEKYPGQDNALKRNQKMMELYNLAGANPMSGCLPMLLQMPILIAMFSFFPSCIELRGEPFLWAEDLSAPDVIWSWDVHIPIISTFFGNHLSLFCLLMTAVNIVYTYLNMQANPSNNSMPGMKWMMYLMPVMFLVFFNNYAAGLSYYYFLSLLITIGQTYAFRFFLKEDKMRARMAERAKKPKKKSGFMARLEEAQRQAQAAQRAQQQRKK